jgi:hypothetical protein
MNLAEALHESICEFERHSTNILMADDPMKSFWLRELMIEDDGYKVAIQRTLDGICADHEDHECYSIWALCRSFDHERQLVIAGAQAIVAGLQEPSSSERNPTDLVGSAISSMAIHLKRFGIKGRYLVEFLRHLRDDQSVFIRSSCLFDGEEFAAERIAVMTQIRLMDEELPR